MTSFVRGVACLGYLCAQRQVRSYDDVQPRRPVIVLSHLSAELEM